MFTPQGLLNNSFDPTDRSLPFIIALWFHLCCRWWRGGVCRAASGGVLNYGDCWLESFQYNNSLRVA